ncbi:DUF2934 domain-containing protein [Lacipirellula sp.]|uniref:DUF2934 domain-containing protein n=1 Tax=Lacipirellula sp. TaxID=2691419 RepID=UPI003D10BAAC
MPNADTGYASDEIAREAYKQWELEGRPEGRHLEHWSTAKVQLGSGCRCNRAYAFCANITRRIYEWLRWFPVPQGNANNAPGDKQAWAVISGIFALAAAPPAVASVLERFDVGFWQMLIVNLAISVSALLILGLLLRHHTGGHLYLDSGNLLWGRILFRAAIIAIAFFNFAYWNDTFRGKDDSLFPKEQESILLSQPVPVTQRLDAKVSIISGPLSRAEVKSLQSFVNRLLFQEVSREKNPEKLKVAWSAPFADNYSSIDCELFPEAQGNTCLAFLAREDYRNNASHITLIPLYFDENDGFLTNKFTIPRPRAGERLLLFFPSNNNFDACVSVSVKHPLATN